MQHVKVDLPKAISMVLEQIEKVGPDFKHSEDPNRNGVGAASCYNMFTEVEYSADGGEFEYTYKPGCLIGRVVIDSYEGDKTDVYDKLRSEGHESSDFWEVTRTLQNKGMLHFDCTDAASRYLRRAQTSQDNQSTWGVAHATALSEALASEYQWANLTPEEMAFFGPRGKVLDLMEAFRLVSEVVKEKGEDFTHQGDPAREDAFNGFGNACVNVFYSLPDGAGWADGAREYIAPGCLVGSAIHKAGWALKTFGEYCVEGGPADELLDNVVDEGLYEEVTPMAQKYMAYVQQEQDHGRPWGIARMNGLSRALWTAFQPFSETTMTKAEWAWLKVRPEWDGKESYGSYSN